MRISFLLGALCVASVTLACDGDGTSEPPPTQPEVTLRGGLSRTTFTYACSQPSDPQCNVDADLAPVRESSPFPALALGSRFQLAVASDSAQYKQLGIDVVAADFLGREADGKTFLAKRTGTTSIVATEANVPIDFANIEVVAPSKFKILQAKPDGDFRGIDVDFSGKGASAGVDTQFTFRFRAIVTGPDDEILAGALPCTWVSSNPDVARITSDPASNMVTLVSGVAGTSLVEVDLGEYHGTVNLEVGQ